MRHSIFTKSLALIGFVALLACTPVFAKAKQHGQTQNPGTLLQLAGLRAGYDTINDAERKYYAGMVVTGGHPRGARIWRIRQTDWYLRIDGFDYPNGDLKRSAVIDQISLDKTSFFTDINAPVIKLSVKKTSLFSAIRIGMNQANVLALLKSKGIVPKLSGNTLAWSQRGSARVTQNITYHTWRTKLEFDKSKRLESISVSCD